jgi:hypothetical protein
MNFEKANKIIIKSYKDFKIINENEIEILANKYYDVDKYETLEKYKIQEYGFYDIFVSIKNNNVFEYYKKEIFTEIRNDILFEIEIYTPKLVDNIPQLNKYTYETNDEIIIKKYNDSFLSINKNNIVCNYIEIKNNITNYNLENTILLMIKNNTAIIKP